MKNRFTKILIGVIISGLFIYFSVKDVEFSKNLIKFEELNLFLIFPIILLFIIPPYLKSLRWKIILSPTKIINSFKLFLITNFGFMLVMFFPFRIGEIYRPYQINSDYKIPFSTAISSVFVERLFDMIGMLFILILALFNADLPILFKNSGYGFSIGFIGIILFMYFLYFKTEPTLKLIRPIIRLFPNKINLFFEKFITNFIAGFGIIAHPMKFITSIILSCIIWTVSGVGVYLIMLFANIDLPFIASFVILLSVFIGISMPAAPGFIGNWQYSCIFALSIFGIMKNEAFGFAMIYYIIAVIIKLLLGISSYFFLDISFKDISSKMNIKNNIHAQSKQNEL